MEKVQINPDRSILFVGGVDPKPIRDLFGEINKLWRENKTEPIFLYVSSPGGIAAAAFGFYDVIRAFNINLITIATGEVASAGNIIFLAGKKRYISKHTFVYIHEPRTTHKESLIENDYTSNLKEIELRKAFMADIITKNTLITNTSYKKMEKKTTVLSPEKCIELGIAHGYFEDLVE